MNSAIERLLSLRVSDVMTTSVVQIGCHENMATAAEILQRHGVSGAPVVDEQGHCVGVISGVDFVTNARDKGKQSYVEEHVLVQDAPGQPYHVEEIAGDRVDQHMTPIVEQVSPTTTIVDAGRMMCKAHIHRLVVLDDHDRPSGVLSSLDLISAMIRAVEE